MSLLSDAQIGEFLASGKLVELGKSENVRQCAYPFHAGKVFFGAASSPPIDWTLDGSKVVFNIPPGALIWIRMKEKINLPNNVCALWWQTHTLSKSGIMLINTSIVDPGYQGYVTGLFINFGRSPVPIYPETVMARLMFFKIETDVANPYVNKLSNQDYDYQVHNLANTGPASFLMVGELASQLTDQKQTAISAIAEEKAKIVNEFEAQKTNIVSTFDQEKRKIINELQDDAPTYFRRSFAWAGVGFVILVAITVCVPWIQKWTRPNLDDYIAESVDKRLSRSFEVPATAVPDAVINLNKRIDDLDVKIAKLTEANEKKK